MPKDKRLYAHFDIGMDENPKIVVLSDAAFRALFEATLYSRRQLSDGFLDARIVQRKWGSDVVAELTSNHPERPTWEPHTKDGVDGYLIHDFAEHQTTKADIEAKRTAGRQGGLAKAANASSTPVAPASGVVEQIGSTNLAKTETETETETATTGVVAKARKRATALPQTFELTDGMREWGKENTPLVDLDAKLGEWMDYWRGRGATMKDWEATWRNGMRKQQEFAVRDAQLLPTIKGDPNAWMQS